MVRTLTYIDWGDFLSKEVESPEFILDFEFDAGFSFMSAVAQRKLKKTGTIVTLDDSLTVPAKLLKFSNLKISDTALLRSVEISQNLTQNNEKTERYFLSATFSLPKINYASLKKELNRRIESNKECSEDSMTRSYLSEHYKKIADIVKNEVFSYIELSGMFARLVNGSYNLYLNENESCYRIFQVGGGEDSAWQHPVHPLLINSKSIQKNYELLGKLPYKVKEHMKKGVRYSFLGFYDESFICYYKIIEATFKNEQFTKIIASELFNCEEKKLLTTLKSSHQKTMMLYIVQWIVKRELLDSSADHNEFINNAIAASEFRNNFAHTIEESSESKRLLPFVVYISNIMIAYAYFS